VVRALRAAGAVARSPLRRGAALRGDGRPCGAFVDLHRRDNSEEKPDGGRYLAAHIPGARFVELDGHDHFPWIGDRVAVINQIQDFLGTVQAEEAYLDPRARDCSLHRHRRFDREVRQ
jgi:pimeloyl-ACP methyl ester carboxylesterase